MNLSNCALAAAAANGTQKVAFRTSLEKDCIMTGLLHRRAL